MRFTFLRAAVLRFRSAVAGLVPILLTSSENRASDSVEMLEFGLPPANGDDVYNIGTPVVCVPLQQRNSFALVLLTANLVCPPRADCGGD